MAIAPSAELTTVMVGKETTFASAVTPTVSLICSNAQFDGTNDYLQRTGARKRIGRTKPATGMFLGKGSFECEADPDTLGAILALTMGAESFALHAGATLAYDHTFTLASPRNSFTAQLGRVLDTINCMGNKVVSLDLSISPKSILMAKVATAYANEAVAGTPVTPTYSTLMPFIFETQGNFGNINGVASDATIQSFGVQIQTGLVTDYPAFGNGRFPAKFPEQTTTVSGPLTLAFETTTMYKNFWGSSSANGPQTIVAPLALDYKFLSTDNADTGVPYSLEIILGTAMIESNSVPLQVGKYLVQSAKFQMYESTNGASDDAKFVLVNTASAASI